MFSALVAPGAGQFMQRRWLAGAFFLTAFLICLLFLLSEVLVPMVENILISIKFAEQATTLPLVPFRVVRIVGWGGLARLVYVSGLLETALVHLRRRRAWTRQQTPAGGPRRL
ncbi:MAG: hypothetical protein GX806_02730 [Lentisphaerae bacterium]|nr:hypothetical protein [Lentisphaerota bacterium]